MKKRKIIAPVAVLMLLCWLMVGCFYVPTFQSVDLHGARSDFRESVGDQNRIQTGRITRDQVEALLGTPQFASKNRRAIGYVVNTRQGIWVSPLCFDARAATKGQTAIKMVFDERDILVRYQEASETTNIPPAFMALGSMSPALFSVHQLNDRQPPPENSNPATDSTEYLYPIGDPVLSEHPATTNR